MVDLLLSVVLRIRAGLWVVMAALRIGESVLVTPGPGGGRLTLVEDDTASVSEFVLEVEIVRDLVFI